MYNNNQRATVRSKSGLTNASWFLAIGAVCALVLSTSLLFASPCRAEIVRGPAQRDTTAHNVALVIGNASYLNVPPLRNPEHDAQDMCAALQTLGYTTMCFVNVETRVHLRAIIEDFVEEVSQDGVALVYYAGHAMQVDGSNYIIPTAIRPVVAKDVLEQSVSLDFLMSQLQRTGAYLSIVLLDACRDNPLRLSDAPHSRGLAEIGVVPDNTEIIYAAEANEQAIDGTGRNGILTKSLLSHLREPGSIDDLYKAVSVDVQREAQELGHRQKPTRYTNFGGRYCFSRCTDLEMLQQQKEEATQQIRDLNARVAAGDRDAEVQLDAAKKANATLASKIKKKEKEDRDARVNVPL